ncbi:MAG: DNA primase [Hyphomonadaceae bacterium]
MRFSDAFLRHVRDRVSIADYAGKKLVWDPRKSRPAAGDFWACCPFHQEKSASFHVLDGKGIFHCFGCSEKGDVFGLAMRLEGISFPEAVSRLAELAGVPLPQAEEEDRGAADARRRLLGVMEKAARLYAEALRGPEGKAARAYLARRGLDDDVCARFGIGYAPAGWTWTLDKLKARGVSLEEALAAGLASAGEGRRPIDVFRNRITFEIADAGGKVIAFGGRALDPAAPAKYVNSPETALFHKGRTLYRLKQARELLARNKTEGLVIAEGYLDVIAFERAGLAAVAPLGTALTEDQLALAWRAGPVPVLCFDGDGAGLKAAARALDLALPRLGPGRTVKIAVLPQGQDPDDLYRAAGPEALAPLLAAAKPASEALFEREAARAPLKTPEAKAALKDRLRQAALRIEDEETRRFYLRELLSKADALIRTPGAPARFPSKAGPAPLDPPEVKAKRAAGASEYWVEDVLRHALERPEALDDIMDLIDRLPLTDPDLKAMRTAIQALTSAVPDRSAIDRAALSRHLQEHGEERALARVSRWPKARSQEGPRDEMEAQWLARMTLDVILPAIRQEIEDLRPLVRTDDVEALRKSQALTAEKTRLEAQALSAGGPGEKVA